MSIALAVRDYLSEHGIKQSFVADKCGWSRQKMNCMINGKAKMTADDFQEICKAVGAPYEIFLNTSQDPAYSSA